MVPRSSHWLSLKQALLALVAAAWVAGCDGSSVVGLSRDGGMDATVDASCGEGQARCNGACVDTRMSVANCGACGNACSFANAIAECSAGACGIAACQPGFGDCDAARSNGCEADLSSDAANCGACGNACATGLSCTAGVCARAPFLVTNTADSGPGSLRQAITDLNASPRGGAIRFNIAPGGPQTITIGATPLPEITRSALVDGATQPLAAGAAPITLSASAGEGFILRVSAPASTLRALTLGGRNVNGISLRSCDGCAVESVVTMSSVGWSVGDTVGVLISRSSGVTVRASTVRGYVTGIRAESCEHVAIEGNDLRGSGAYSAAWEVDQAAISAIYVIGAWAPDGSYLKALEISGNTFDTVSRAQVYLYGLRGGVIAGAPGPDVDIALESSRGFGGAAGYALRLEQSGPSCVVRDLDVSWRGSSTPTGVGLSVLSPAATIERIRAERREVGIERHIGIVPPSTIRCSSFAGSVTAISEGISSAVSDCDLSNVTIGVALSTDPYTRCDASGNWWGSASGPSNLGGSGTAYTGDVTVSSWLSARPTCAP